jgi:hypothetical protein
MCCRLSTRSNKGISITRTERLGWLGRARCFGTGNIIFKPCEQEEEEDEDII